jgi:hypothetical protein
MENSEARKRREAKETLEQRELEMLTSFGAPIVVPQGSLVQLAVAR